jgi:hypothetical protein
MALTNAFKDAVAEGKIMEIRIMLKDSLLVDPTFSRFDEMEKAAAGVQGLYDAHDGRALEDNEELWDDAYMDKLMVQVVGNFSHKRVEHLKKVVRKLRPVPTSDAPKKINNNDAKRSYQEQKRCDQESGNYRGAVVAGGAVAGGIVGGVIGAAASFSAAGVAACAVGVAVIGGVAADVCYKNK